MNTIEKAAFRCFYLGLLPVSANKDTLARALSHLGLVWKIRVARDDISQSCKGYGYVWIKLLGSADNFVRGCLALSIPVLAFPIEAPRMLGRENTRFLRRFVRLETPMNPICHSETARYLQSFGRISFMAAEVSVCESGLLYRAHVLYTDEIPALRIASVKRHIISQRPVQVNAFAGCQEYPFIPIPYSKIFVAIDEYVTNVDGLQSFKTEEARLVTKVIKVEENSNSARNIEVQTKSKHLTQSPSKRPILEKGPKTSTNLKNPTTITTTIDNELKFKVHDVSVCLQASFDKKHKRQNCPCQTIIPDRSGSGLSNRKCGLLFQSLHLEVCHILENLRFNVLRKTA